MRPTEATVVEHATDLLSNVVTDAQDYADCDNGSPTPHIKTRRYEADLESSLTNESGLTGDLTDKMPQIGGLDYPRLCVELLNSGPTTAQQCVDAWIDATKGKPEAHRSALAAVAHDVFCRLNCVPILDTPEKAEVIAKLAALNTERDMTAEDWKTFDTIRFQS